MKAIVLAGGSGTRLWPLSRKNFPKQFLSLNRENSLFRQTVDRLLTVLSSEDIVVMTNNDYKFYVKSELNPLSVRNIILEPAGRNTAPAIALAVKYCMERLRCDESEVLFVSPSDHIIEPASVFGRHIAQAENIAKEGHIVTFGIRPAGPETGYGYIKVNAECGMRSAECGVRSEESRIQTAEYFKVEEFTEKPDLKTAEAYIKDKAYYWNSGMFAFSIGTMLKEFAGHAPAIREMLDMNFDDMLSNFDKMPDLSIDYAIAEKSSRVVMLPLELSWNDIGSWDSLHDISAKDENGNVISGDVMAVDTKNSLIFGNKRLVSTVGMEDCLIVETDDAVLVAKKGEAQKVREIVGKLKKENRKEITEHLTICRPWGNYTVLEEGARYKIKRIVVNPLEKLSLQKHYHRSEHWVVVKGTARVTIGDREIFIHENESAYVPKSTVHRLENPGRVPLEIIEVQNGEYVGEDDIVRMEDVYER